MDRMEVTYEISGNFTIIEKDIIPENLPNWSSTEKRRECEYILKELLGVDDLHITNIKQFQRD